MYNLPDTLQTITRDVWAYKILYKYNVQKKNLIQVMYV